MAEVTRKSVLALVAETTRGTPVAVGAATDYTALQEDVSIAPSFDELENAELANSIGQKETVLGMERPTMSFSHYMRHSGVEATAPDYNLLLKSLFGQEDIAAAEYNTVASSTAGTSTARAVVKVDSAEGATFQRGEALLIKDGTNGYSVRNIYSISSDDLTLGFNLATAPGTAIELGRAILYSPAAADSTYPALSAWMFRGDGAAVELVSGLRCTDLSIGLEAGQMINGNFSLQGLEYYFNPIVISSANKYIDLTDDGGTIVITLTEGTYKDPNELAAHIQTVGAVAVAASGADDFLCTYASSTGKFTISTTTGTLFSILWKTGTHGADNADDSVAAAIGFADAADDTGALTYTSDSAIDWSTQYTPNLDSEKPAVAKDIEVMWGHYNEYACKAASSVSISVGHEVADVNSICTTSGRSDTVFSGRTVTVDATILLTRHEADTFTRYRQGTSVPFACTWGRKSATNWVAGSVGNFYLPDATITSFEVSDEGGLVVLNLSLRAYVGEDQTQEVFFNFL
jgi:hypothetical protein